MSRPPTNMGNRGGSSAPLSMPAWWPCCFLLLFQAMLCYSLNQSCNPHDLRALRGFFESLEVPLPGWDLDGPSTSCCDWFGVRCDWILGGRVIALELGNMHLRGSISGSLAGLDHLKSLDLSGNSLQGPVPPQLFQLPRLELLDLGSNKFSGSIPSNSCLPSIQVFNISGNFFHGMQPLLAGSRNLTIFDVSGNVFSGSIDPGICNSSARVQVLRFSWNRFAGDFPSGFGNCRSLVELSLCKNMITGTLPDELFTLPSLARLILRQNMLYGPVSLKLGDLTELVLLDISYNNFSGTIPDVFDSLKKLELFSANDNRFEGGLPASLSDSSMLRVINLSKNFLGGKIRLNFTALARLRSLNLGSNLFSGPIPYDLPQCTELVSLNLAKNNLVGEIPQSFQTFSALSHLSLALNKLSNISSALQILQHCPNLTVLVLTKNFQGGEMMPYAGIQGFEKMEVLVIADCLLSGRIPPWLAKLTKLKVLDVSWNHLSGNIPSWLGHLERLFYLDLSNNSLSGEIPDSLAKMKSLISMNATRQREDSFLGFPFQIKRNSTARGLQYNKVTSFPPSLILSHNMLVGPILPGFGDLVALLALDLSWNNLSGTIPEKLSGMSSLELLDLSHNNLSGSIPSSLIRLSFLSSFSVAYNNLVGSIPTEGQFSTFSGNDFMGNPGLRGGHRSPSPPNTPTSSASRATEKGAFLDRGVIIGMAFGIGLGAGLLLTAIYFTVSRIYSRRRGGHSNARVKGDSGESLEPAGSGLVLLFDNEGLSIDDIVEATNNFDQAHIIGRGGFGQVYKATLPDGRKVAIKQLFGDEFQMEREFRAEVQALSKAQHWNLVSLQGYCKTRNDRLLIYPYMENGSLDYLLHEKKTDEGSTLDWETRLRIAQGAARGLAYLHHSCEPHILHRDIKSSNILLDENFEAHLGDFGLARLVRPHGSHVTTDLVGTVGYVPPEYGQSPVATFKGDVYSFGVVLLELLTGRRPLDACTPKGCNDVVSWVREMAEEKREAEVLDPHVYDEENHSQLTKVLEIATLCVSDSPGRRPLMEQLVAWLDDIPHC